MEQVHWASSGQALNKRDFLLKGYKIYGMLTDYKDFSYKGEWGHPINIC